MKRFIDPLQHIVHIQRSTIHGHIYRRHPELKGKQRDIEQTISNPDFIARSKKDTQSLLYFRRINELFFLMVVASPIYDHDFELRTCFYVLNTSKGDPIIWRKKIST
ncbi:MAG: hypothetical protein HYV41_00905 [Candidatus Magasanikbacteria bacterium]|nr:hypothetical protein [Candidatus Magasanikbacteria bacterium]